MLADNAAALALYSGLGYRVHHDYRYRADAAPTRRPRRTASIAMTQPPDNSKLLVISFDDPLRAQEYLLAAARLQRDRNCSCTTR